MHVSCRIPPDQPITFQFEPEQEGTYSLRILKESRKTLQEATIILVRGLSPDAIDNLRESLPE